MNTSFNQWMQQEEAWAEEIEARRRKKTWITAAVTFVLCVAAVAGIGFLGAGVEAGINNIKYGVIFGIFSVGIFVLVMLCGSYKKLYMKSLKKEIGKELTTDALKEEFAEAMLDKASGSSRCLEFAWQKGAESDRFCTASRFAVLRGVKPCIVQLDKVERIELDELTFKTTSNIGDYKVKTAYTSYPIFFYYRQAGAVDKKKQKVDKLISFPSTALRDQAIHMMQEKQKITT